MTMTKSDLADVVAGETFFKKNEAVKFVEDFFEVIASTLENGEMVKIPGFGNFMLRSKKQREGRNPKTGEKHVIKARTVVSFRASNLLKREIRDQQLIKQSA